MKHIESIQPELAADELDRIVREEGDATATAALTALLHSVTGCDIPQTSALPESEVEELVPLCVSILRRHWQTPLTCLGDGITPMSLADLMRQSIGDRVQGNEAWSIPPVHANIPTALTALRQRDMSSGLTLTLSDGTTTQAPDGLSLAQLLCGSDVADTITELKDDNVGWTMTKNLPTNITGSLTKLRIGCAYVLNFPANTYLPTTLTEIEFPELISWGITSEYRPLFIYNNPNITELTFPKCKAIGMGFSYDSTSAEGTFIHGCSNLRKVSFPEMTTFGEGIGDGIYGSAYSILIKACENLEEVYMPKWNGYRSWRIVRQVPNLRKLVLGVISSGVPSLYSSTAYPFSHCTNLVHLEIQGCVVSLDLRSWSPTNVLADEELTKQFLSNFKTYIADRVADRTGKTALTLTLSSAVYAALEAQEGQTILATLANKNWNVAQA